MSSTIRRLTSVAASTVSAVLALVLLAGIIAGGKDAGSILIAEGLAVPFVCSGTRCPKTPRPWCES